VFDKPWRYDASGWVNGLDIKISSRQTSLIAVANFKDVFQAK